MVAAAHAVVVYPTDAASAAATAGMLYVFNGSSAVMLFFVLSGLVLGQGLHRSGAGSVREYSAYVVRRVFRIYPVFLLSTMVVLTFLFWAHAQCAQPFWFDSVLKYRSSVLNTGTLPAQRTIIDNLLFQSSSLNLVTWTLGVEILCSLLLPLAHYARLRLPPLGTLLLLAASVLLVFVGKWLLLLGLVVLEGAFNWETLGFFFLFYLGYLLPVVGPKLFAKLAPSRRLTAGLMIISVTIFLVAARLGDAHGLVTGTAACLMLGTMLYGYNLPVLKVLDWPLVRFYGRISYSFYLLHDLLLISGARMFTHWILDGKMPAYPLLANLLLIPASIALATGLAWAAYRWIELPCMQFGKRLAKTIRERAPFPKGLCMPLGGSATGTNHPLLNSVK
jgi:peptidoglycan/LPS O-acetylase OafA/YrhL